jgi:hypothetical protein
MVISPSLFLEDWSGYIMDDKEMGLKTGGVAQVITVSA